MPFLLPVKEWRASERGKIWKVVAEVWGAQWHE